MEDVIKSNEYYCKKCNKIYKTYKILWEYNKKFIDIDNKEYD